MNNVNWIQIILAILSGLSVCIPLVIQLVNVVRNATKERNWNILIKMTMDYMAQAEKNFKTGAERKEWVMSMVITGAATINYPMTDEDIRKVSDLIDAICDASKIINNEAERAAALKTAEEKAKDHKSK